MVEQEYVTIQSHIRKTPFGMEKSDKLIGKADNLSEDFKEELWEDYSIDIDKMKLKKDE